MKSNLDLATAVAAIWVTAYAVIALACTCLLSRVPPQEIRIVAVSIAVTLAVLVVIDFFGKKLA